MVLFSAVIVLFSDDNNIIIASDVMEKNFVIGLPGIVKIKAVDAHIVDVFGPGIKILDLIFVGIRFGQRINIPSEFGVADAAEKIADAAIGGDVF